MNAFKKIIAGIGTALAVACSAPTEELPLPVRKAFTCNPTLGDILFTSTDYNERPLPPPTLWTVKEDGSNLHQIPTQANFFYPLATTKDGCGLVYSSGLLDDWEPDSLNVMNTDGSNPRKIADLQASEGITFSPDGNQVGYSAIQRPEGCTSKSCVTGSIQLTDLIEGTTKEIAGPLSALPQWSPRGDYIAFVTLRREEFDNAIDSINLYKVQAGTTKKLITPAGLTGEISWLPDGTQLAVSSGVNINDPEWKTNLYLISVDGTQRRISLEGFATGFKWSPDGKNVAFVSVVKDDPRQDGLYTLSLSNPTPSHIAQRYFEYDWSPDSTKIAFSEVIKIPIDPFNPTIATFVYNTITKNTQRLSNGTDSFPDQSTSPKWSLDGERITYLQATSTTTANFLSVKPDGTQQRQITNLPTAKGRDYFLLPQQP